MKSGIASRRGAPERIDPEHRFVLHGISWETYERLLHEIDDGAIRLTYDRGALEIMSPSRHHEKLKKLIARMIEIFTLELGIAIASGGSTTFRQALLERGLEPDECYWIASEPRMRHKDDYDPESDPPPDLVVEVEISRSALDRLGIYAALGVPEVWRWNDERLVPHRLGKSGAYSPARKSRALPFLAFAEVERFLARRLELDENSLIRSFRDWVRENLLDRS